MGEPGVVEGITAAEAVLAGPVPIALVAVTVKVYEVPLVRPDTVHPVAPVVVQVCDPGDEVTVYPVMGEPPLEAGAVQETDTEEFAGAPTTPVGAPGGPPGVATAEADEAGPLPMTFTASTSNSYPVPLVSVVTVHVVVVHVAGEVEASGVKLE